MIAYHYFPVTAHGGLIGVDIFFVISGFLITSIVAEEMNHGRFRFGDFYARRVRRIFPAVAVVLAFCLAVGAVLLDVGEFHELGLQVAAGAGFLSNVLLWSETGYFDEAAVYKPLLHLWSLAVEEQFYIIWPSALYFCARFRRPLWAIAVVFAGASFALNLYLSETDGVADFYFIFSRIWELLIGALLAVTAPSALHGRSALANGAATIGAALVVAGLLLIDDSHPFPGWRALAPTLGAVLVIAAGPRAIVNARLLSNRLMVAIGKISYPLYLWHWPLLAFARLDLAGNIPLSMRWTLIATAIALSQATYLYVEKPIRFGPSPAKRTALAAATVAALGLVGLHDFRAGGLFFPNATLARVANEGDVGLFEYRKYFMAHSAPCNTKTFPPFASGPADPFRCGQSVADLSPEIVILGDSHAQHLFLGLAEALPERNVAFFIETGLPSINNPLFASTYAALAAEPTVKTIILSAEWKFRLSLLANGANLRDDLERTVRFLRAAGKDVDVINDLPIFTFRAGRCKFAGRLGVSNLCDEEETKLESQLGLYAGDLAAAVTANPGARLIDTAHMFCSGAVCSMAANGKLFYRDENHLNINGSRFIGAKIVTAAPELRE